MKWRKKGHEFDEIAECIVSNFKEKEKICIWGAGKLGRRLLPTLKKYKYFDYFIDNDKMKQKCGYMGEMVNSFEAYQLENNNEIIVICATLENGREIKKLLETAGKIENKDFYFYEKFIEYYFPILIAYAYNECFIGLVQIVLTSRCTLKCESCAHGCQVLGKSKDLTLEEVYFTLDSFFDKVDYVEEFVLIGGEPLLYTQIAAVIEYFGEKYMDRIGSLSITTNGTMIPSDDVLAVSKRYNVYYNISDYSKEIIRLKKLYQKLTGELDDKKIEYGFTKTDKWVDFGFQSVNRKIDTVNLIKFFDECKTTCREVRGNRFYYCVTSRTSAEAYGYLEGEKEFLDFNNLENDNKKIILEYHLGYSAAGYLGMCRRCNGCIKVNKNSIPVARQVDN